MEKVGMKMLDLSFFSGKRIFITGHTGFKGSWLSFILVQLGAKVTGFSLDFPTDPSLFNLINLSRDVKSIRGDIRDFNLLSKSIDEAEPEIVIHMAAQPIVRLGYKDPVGTYSTNVMGTVNICESIRKSKSIKSFLNVTTDKVYKNSGQLISYKEDAELDGYDPYSNSKSCSELVTHSYKLSFLDERLSVSTARSGNVIGGGDFSIDRIIPDCIRAVKNGEEIEVRNPDSIRPYQHVLEPLYAYLLIAEKQFKEKKYASFYNVGPDYSDCVTTRELVDLFVKHWGDNAKWVERKDFGPHEDSFLSLDCSKIKKNLLWKPQWNISISMEKTVQWYKAWLSGEDLRSIMKKQVNDFLENAK